MAGKKFVRLIDGEFVEVKGVQTAGTAGQAGDIPALDSAGRINQNMMPVGIGAVVETMPDHPDNLSAGDFVNIWDDSGARKARKADASNGRRAHGFVLATESEGNVDVYLSGVNVGVTVAAGEVGKAVYLGTGGGFTTTAPDTTGHISQEIGIVVGQNKVEFEAQRPVTLA